MQYSAGQPACNLPAGKNQFRLSIVDASKRAAGALSGSRDTNMAAQHPGGHDVTTAGICILLQQLQDDGLCELHRCCWRVACDILQSNI